MNNYDYDLLILGAGPGGYVAAIRASQLGLKAAVIEKDKVGGVCLNIGCIPSKALIHQAERYLGLKEMEDTGIVIDRSGFNYQKVYEKSRSAADKLSQGVQFLLKKNKVPVIEGEGIITGKHEITLKNGRNITAKNIILATGSKPREIPGFIFDEQTIMSSTGALMLQKLPKSLLILGSGAIGVEFAHIMNAFGVEVYLVEMLDQVLPIEDADTVDVLVKSFKKRGIHIYTSTKAVSQKKVGDLLQVTLEDKNKKTTNVEVDKILVSAGRIPNTSGIGLEKLGIELERGGFILVGDYYQTSVPSVFAIGDVVKTPLLAHVASKEGEIAVEYIAGHKPVKSIDLMAIPGATYCEPQIASFGLTEKAAKEKDLVYNKSIFPYRGAGKAVAIEQAEGLVKVLSDKNTGEIIGAHIVGANATELIHEILLAKTAELLPEDIANMIHAHPTLSEAVMETMRGLEGLPIHM